MVPELIVSVSHGLILILFTGILDCKGVTRGCVSQKRQTRRRESEVTTEMEVEQQEVEEE